MTTMENTFNVQPRGLTLAEMISAGVYKVVLLIERLIVRRG